jgi:hypothetical protein
MSSTASLHIQSAIEMLLHAHALANMHRVNGRAETAKSALDWFDKIEWQIKTAKEELAEAAIIPPHGGKGG